MNLLKTISDYWPLVLAGLSVIAGWGIWRLNEHFVTDKAFLEEQKIRERDGMRIGKLEEGHAALKNRVDSLPTLKSMHRIELRLGEIEGQYKVVSAQLKGQEAALQRISNTLERITESGWGNHEK